GCAVNDFADRKFDAHVERTKDRPLAAGLIKPWEALVVAAVLAACAFAIVLAVIYPFLKRFFWLPQAWLGLAFGFGIPMAFAANTGEVPELALVLLRRN